MAEKKGNYRNNELRFEPSCKRTMGYLYYVNNQQNKKLHNVMYDIFAKKISLN